jgi:hypothetical protein
VRHPGRQIDHNIIIEMTGDGRVTGCFAFLNGSSAEGEDKSSCEPYFREYGSLSEPVRRLREAEAGLSTEEIGERLMPDAFYRSVPQSLGPFMKKWSRQFSANSVLTEDRRVYCEDMCYSDGKNTRCRDEFNCAVKMEAANQWVLTGSPIADLEDCEKCQVALAVSYPPVLLLANEDQRPIRESTRETGGLFRWDPASGWTDLTAGVGWGSMNDVAAVGRVVAVALSPQIGGGSGGQPRNVPGVRLSRDGGETWDALVRGLTLPVDAKIRLVAVFSTGQVIANAQGRLWSWRVLTIRERLRFED